jgi:signal peptidase II
LDFHIGDSHWPAFNVADSFICVGAGMIILSGLVAKYIKKEE